MKLLLITSVLARSSTLIKKMFRFVLLASLVAAAIACDGDSVVVTESRTVTTTTRGGAGGVALADASSALLSGRDRQIISQTWAQAKNDGDIAPKTFLRLFKLHPQYQKLFAAFADVPQDQLAGNGNFLAQAYTVMAGLDVVIQSLGSDALLLQRLTDLGTAHFARNVKAIQFQEFSRVLVDVLSEEVKLSSEARDAWTRGLQALVDIVAKNLREPSQVADPITGITPALRNAVQAAWAAVRDQRSAIGIETFQKLFAAHPEYQKAFAKFANVPAGALAGNADFVAQSDLVINRVDTIISNLGNKLTLLGNLRYMGHSHAPRAITRQHFENFEEAFLSVLQSRGVSADAINSLDQALTLLIGQIAKNLN